MGSGGQSSEPPGSPKSVITTVPTLGEQAEHQRQACLNSNRPSRAAELSNMSQADYRDRQFLAVIGDEVRSPVSLALLASSADQLAGLSNRSAPRRHWCKLRGTKDNGLYLTFGQHVTTGPDSQKNFLVVDSKTDNATIESTFDKLIERKDIGIILINQHASYIFFAREMVPYF